MKIPDELINQATAKVLRGVMQESGLTQKTWADKSGLSITVVQKLLSGNQSVKVPQLLALATASAFSPEEVMERIDRGVARAVSEMPVSLDAHRSKKPADMTDTELEELRGAAGRDAELEEDEPDGP
ncbi:helix-turn-helix domain-containing protein [Microbacterium sp. 1P06AB]|uniref:helix-turn-helix domain-containing protein n=1 Tax=Microbacterium sp. 1P06AB TaxID=3132289 RepID=UPI0039A72BC2